MPERIGTGRAADERPLTVEQAAEFLRCSPSHVRDLCREGQIGHFRLGRLIRIPIAALRELEGCASSGSEMPSMPTGETAENQSAPRSGLRIVRSPNGD